MNEGIVYYKICSKCKENKNSLEFYHSSATRDKFYAYCKKCSNENAKRYSSIYYFRKLRGIGKNRVRGYRGKGIGKKGFKSLKEYRKFILLKYGHECICCGENKFEFLAIDHIENNGQEMRKIHRNGFYLYKFIEEMNFPSIFQILCHNCNMAKGFYGICPHQQSKQEWDSGNPLVKRNGIIKDESDIERPVNLPKNN